MNRTKQIVEAGLFAAIMVIWMLAIMYLPLFGPLLMMVVPLPVILLTIRNTNTNVIVSTIVATLITSALITVVNGLTLGVTALSVGLPLGIAYKKKYKPLKSILLGAAGMTIGFLIMIGLAQMVFGISLLDQIDELFTMSGEVQQEMGNLLSGLDSASLNASMEESASMLEQMRYLMRLIFPSLIIISSVSTSIINFLFVRPILKRLRIEVPPLGSFTEFSYPKHVAYGSLFMLAMAYFVGAMGIVDPELVMSNFIYLFLMVFFVQGISLFLFILGKYVPRGIALLILFIFVSRFLFYIAFIGFLDVLFGFRKRKGA